MRRCPTLVTDIALCMLSEMASFITWLLSIVPSTCTSLGVTKLLAAPTVTSLSRSKESFTVTGLIRNQIRTSTLVQPLAPCLCWRS
ncbi:hypothetical protein PRUPE_5G043500 [Prunus persica]|uniref:Uncharacterized protein n=1 Tax=Prunus persica TaxID=3760 RepID=M5WR15_PRUPE|nr:hypothetical protein PRUPE_5G043500 [Prunus persica]